MSKAKKRIKFRTFQVPIDMELSGNIDSFVFRNGLKLGAFVKQAIIEKLERES